MRRPIPKPKSKKQMERADPDLDQYLKILIVTEGEKTEVTYFNSLKAELRIPSAKVVISGDSDSSPDKVLQHAISICERDADYDIVYVVFDKDRHSTYASTIDRVNAISGSSDYGEATFKAITSVPCFEIWLMLHNGYSNKPYASSKAGGSPAAEVIKDLKSISFFRNYQKNCCDYYPSISEKRQDAISHAKRLIADGKAVGDKPHYENPSTRVHLLVEDMLLLIQKNLKK